MELVYLYIFNAGEESPLNKLELNFSNRHYISIENPESHEETVVNIKSRENTLKDFFGENILNANAIVGSNGSGKTSLFNFLSWFTSAPSIQEKGHFYKYDRYEFVAIFWDNETQTFKGYSTFWKFTQVVVLPIPLKLKLGEVIIDGENLIWEELNENEGRKIVIKIPDDFPKISVVKYCPILNLNDYPLRFDEVGYFDYSSDFLIQTDIRKGLITEENEAFKAQEVRRGLHFISYSKDKGDNWDSKFFTNFIPKEINIKVQYYKRKDHEFRYIDANSSNVYDKLNENFDAQYNVHKIILNAPEGIHSDQERDQSAAFLLELFLYKAFVEEVFNTMEYRGDKYRNPQSYLKNIISTEWDELNGESLEPFVQFVDKQKIVSPDNVNNFKGLVQKVVTNSRLNDDRLICSIDHAELFFEIDSTFDQVKSDNKRSMFLFGWRDMSSGQRAMLTFFSRLFDAFLEIERTRSKDEPVYFFLDEPDTGFHPKWQVQYFSELLEYIKKVFAEYDCQLFIASHSAFSLSDFPDANVGYFGESPKVKTFGANVTSLLADSFYLSDGLIGKFAVQKIQESINILNKARRDIDSVSDMEVDKVKYLISVIAEPILRSKLSEMYHEIFTDQIFLNAQIEELKVQLNKLEKRKK